MNKVRQGIVLGIISLLLMASSSGSGGSIDPKRIFAQSEPATVLIIADFSAHAVVPSATIDEPALQAELEAEVANGQVASDQNSLVIRAFQLVATKTDTYVKPTKPDRQADASFEATGSGFIIDPSGYIVTNAHVAAPKDDQIKEQLATIGLKSLVTEDVKSFQDSASTGGINLPNDLQQQLFDSDANWISEHLQITDLKKTFSAALGANIPGITTGLKLIPGDVVAAGEEVPGKDVAILKVEQSNLPTLPLGDDSSLQVGDKLFVLGYPGNATFHPLLSKESVSEPSFTAGQMSARKTSAGGFTVIQTDAAVTHGNSGGPVFNSQGQVVGIATFGAQQQGNGTELAGFNFIMPATLIKQFVDRSGAHPAQGLFSKLYNQALDREAQSHFRDALKAMTEINTIAPGHPYVQQHISLEQAAIASGKDKSGGSSPLIPILIVLVVVVVLVGAVLLLLLRRKKPSPPQYAMAGPPPIPALSYASSPSPSPDPTTLPPGAGPTPTAPTMEMPAATPTAPTPEAPPVTQSPAAPAAPAPPETAAPASPGQPRFCRSCGADLAGKPFCGTCGASAT